MHILDNFMIHYLRRSINTALRYNFTTRPTSLAKASRCSTLLFTKTFRKKNCWRRRRWHWAKRTCAKTSKSKAICSRLFAASYPRRASSRWINPCSNASSIRRNRNRLRRNRFRPTTIWGMTSMPNGSIRP